MSDEFEALICNNTWTLVPFNSATNIVGCKWIFRTKYNLNGSISCLKARLVAKGFTQHPDIDYIDTFSPIIKPCTLRILLSIVVTNGWSLCQLDINNAFLLGTLDEDVHTAQPLGFLNSTNLTFVCKLNKAIYSLK